MKLDEEQFIMSPWPLILFSRISFIALGPCTTLTGFDLHALHTLALSSSFIILGITITAAASNFMQVTEGFQFPSPSTYP